MKATLRTMRRWTRTAGIGLLAACTCGCNMSQPRAQELANARWNDARARVKTRLASDQLAAGDFAGAARELTAAEELSPNDPALATLWARFWLAEGKTAEAVAVLEEAELEGPAKAEAQYLLGVARQQQHQWEDALESYRAACELDPREITYAAAAVQSWLQLGRAAEAVAFLKSRAPRFGWTSGYQAMLAECHEQTGNWERAADAWQRVVGTPHADEGIRNRLAIALFRANRATEALPVIRQLVSTATPEDKPRLQRMLAECHLAEGQPAEAQKQIQLLLQRDQRDAAALRLLARAFVMSGREAEALRVARRAVATDATDPRSLELAAALAWRTGERGAAVATATKLLAVERENPVAHHMLASDGRAK